MAHFQMRPIYLFNCNVWRHMGCRLNTVAEQRLKHSFKFLKKSKEAWSSRVSVKTHGYSTFFWFGRVNCFRPFWTTYGGVKNQKFQLSNISGGFWTTPPCEFRTVDAIEIRPLVRCEIGLPFLQSWAPLRISMGKSRTFLKFTMSILQWSCRS